MFYKMANDFQNGSVHVPNVLKLYSENAFYGIIFS